MLEHQDKADHSDRQGNEISQICRQAASGVHGTDHHGAEDGADGVGHRYVAEELRPFLGLHGGPHVHVGRRHVETAAHRLNEISDGIRHPGTGKDHKHTARQLDNDACCDHIA